MTYKHPLIPLLISLAALSGCSQLDDGLSDREIKGEAMPVEVAPKVISAQELYASYRLQGVVNFNAFKSAYRVATNSPYSNGKFAVIDFTAHSETKRFHLFDHERGGLILSTYVSHGVSSGGAYAKEFSNKKGSNMSSLGHILGAEPYVGRNGYSLRLDGMTIGVNDKLRSRYISLHPSLYATEKHIKVNKMLGRSDGCLAVPPKHSRTIIDTLSHGGIIYSYFE